MNKLQRRATELSIVTHNPRRTVAILTLTLAILMATATAFVFTTTAKNNQPRNVKSVKISVYWDYYCLNKTLNVDWGTISPGNSEVVVLYIRNEGTTSVILSLNVLNPNPVNLEAHLKTSWNREGLTLRPGSVTKASITLSAQENTSVVADFSFDLLITGEAPNR